MDLKYDLRLKISKIYTRSISKKEYQKYLSLMYHKYLKEERKIVVAIARWTNSSSSVCHEKGGGERTSTFQMVGSEGGIANIVRATSKLQANAQGWYEEVTY